MRTDSTYCPKILRNLDLSFLTELMLLLSSSLIFSFSYFCSRFWHLILFDGFLISWLTVALMRDSKVFSP